MDVLLWDGMTTEVDGMQQTELARFLEAKVKEKGYRELEDEIHVPRSTISKIVHGQLKGLPELETLIKIATVYNIPLWRVVEMTGADAGIARTPSDQGRRVDALMQAHPDTMSPIVDRLLQRDPTDLRGVLAYLEAILRQDA